MQKTHARVSVGLPCLRIASTFLGEEKPEKEWMGTKSLCPRLPTTAIAVDSHSIDIQKMDHTWQDGGQRNTKVGSVYGGRIDFRCFCTCVKVGE
jgi:hypothetical protein